MTDLITRLRTWSHARHSAPASDLMDEAANYIELLEAANATSHSGFMVMASVVDGMKGEIERLNKLREEDGVAMGALIAGYQRLQAACIDGLQG